MCHHRPADVSQRRAQWQALLEPTSLTVWAVPPTSEKGIKCELNHIPCHCKAHSPNTPTPTKADKRGMRIRQTVRNAPSRQRCAIEAFVNHTPDTLAGQPSRNALQTSATRQPYAYNPPRQRRGALAEGGGPPTEARKHSTQKGTSENGYQSHAARASRD